MTVQRRRCVYYFVAHKKHDDRRSNGRTQDDLAEGETQLSRVG